MATINKNNLLAYLQYLGSRTGKLFPPEVLQRWNSLAPAQVDEHLRVLHQRLGLTELKVIQFRNEFLAMQARAGKKKGGGRFWIILAVVLVILGLAGWYVFSKYRQFSSMDYVYALADNVAVREGPDASSVSKERMDLFGYYINKDGSRLATFTKLRLLKNATENGFYEVSLNESFFSYLVGSDGSSRRYVNAKFVTTSQSEHENFASKLSNLKDDYNELDKLQLNYRRLIVNAIAKDPTLANLKPARPCVFSDKKANEEYLSIGQCTTGDKSESYVIANFSDGKCYSIQGDANMEAVSVRLVEQTGFFGNTELEGSFKFKYSGNRNGALGSFTAILCGAGTNYVSGSKPFALFTEQ